MSKKATRLICILLAVLMVFGVAAYALSAGAFAVTQSEIDALQKQRDAIRDQQKDVQEQIDALNDEMAGVIERKTALDQQNELNRQDVELINEQIELYDQMIEDKEEELDQAIQNEKDQFEHYCARVRTMEERSTLSYVSILLKATSLSDFLSRLNDVMDIVRNDQNVKAEYIAAREQVEEVKAEYETVQEEQKEKRTELLEEKARLEEQIDAACKIIAQLEDDIEEYKAMYEENEALEAEVQAKIDEKVAALQKQKEEEERARQAYLEQLKKQQQRRRYDERRLYLARLQLHLHNLQIRLSRPPDLRHDEVSLRRGHRRGLWRDDYGCRRRHRHGFRVQQLLRQLLRHLPLQRSYDALRPHERAAQRLRRRHRVAGAGHRLCRLHRLVHRTALSLRGALQRQLCRPPQLFQRRQLYLFLRRLSAAEDKNPCSGRENLCRCKGVFPLFGLDRAGGGTYNSVSVYAISLLYSIFQYFNREDQAKWVPKTVIK